jgi:glycosyltransferase involved in cell wall biosynthesis
MNENDKSKIKILYFICGIKSGGVEEMLTNFCSNMDKSIMEFSVAYQHEPIAVCKEKLEKAGCKCYRIASKASHPLKNLLDTYHIIKEGKYDIVHAHMNLTNFIPLFCAKLCGVKIRISHSHTCEENKPLYYRIYASICRLLIRMFATHDFACGAAAGRYLYGAKKMRQGKVTVLPNGIDLHRFRFELDKRHEVRRKYGVEGKKVIGHVGRFVPLKNHRFLLSVFNLVAQKEPDAILWLIGSGDLEDQLRAQVTALHLEGRVVFMGSRSDISDLYKAMDVFVLPSLYEGFPIACVEAQAAGLPCLLSQTIENDVVLSDRVSFLPIGKGQESVWAKEILAAGVPEEDRIQFPEKLKAFDIVHCAKELENDYRRMLAEA